jgi:hypothetical protein
MNSDTYVYLDGSRVFAGWEKIDNDDFVHYLSDRYGEDAGDAWNRYRNGYRTGLGLTIAGGSCMVLGGTAAVIGGLAALGTVMYFPLIGTIGSMAGSDPNDMLDTMLEGPALLADIGGVVALGGLAMLVSGIPVMCVYKNRMTDHFNTYGSGIVNEVNLTFGPQSRGIGFALNF